ncbi:IS21 family transposase [Hydrogenibacillus schlegelii]|nr:IS21 family transposase [Hydrogenibacillus schlegelii]
MHTRSSGAKGWSKTGSPPGGQRLSTSTDTVDRLLSSRRREDQRSTYPLPSARLGEECCQPSPCIQRPLRQGAANVIAGVKLTRDRQVGTDPLPGKYTLRIRPRSGRCPRQHAGRWEGETLIRASWRGSVHPGDRANPRHLPEHGAAVLARHRGAQAGTSGGSRLEARPVQSVYPATGRGRSGKLRRPSPRAAVPGLRGGLHHPQGVRPAPASPPIHPWHGPVRDAARHEAQVDWGSCAYTLPDGTVRRKRVFAMVLSWSRALYVEFVDRADTATFIRCHLNAFRYFGGVPETCLYDRTKLVVLGLDEKGEPKWNERFLDFALQLGFGIRLCQGYRPQTKGRVESGIKDVKGNFWPAVRFTDLNDLNRQALAWCDTVANVHIHGTTHERPVDRLAIERGALRPLPSPKSPPRKTVTGLHRASPSAALDKKVFTKIQGLNCKSLNSFYKTDDLLSRDFRL